MHLSEPQVDDPQTTRVRLTHRGPLDATQLLDLYVPLPGSPGVTILYDGDVSPAAVKWARRLEIELVRVDTAPAAPVVPTVLSVPMTPGVRSVPDIPTVPTVPTVPNLGTELPEPPAEPTVFPDPTPAPLLPMPAVAAPQSRPEPQVIVAASEPEPELVHAPLTEPALPWEITLADAEPAPVHVEIGEMLAFPWNTLDTIAQRAGAEDDHHEVMTGNARRVPTLEHPTSLLPKGPNWGLPWPRPVAQNDMIAKADPRLWQGPERLAAMRDDLEKVGAPSFGAAKPDGSAWLKKISDAG